MAFAVAAAAGVAVYFAVTPHVTFEDAIAADNSGSEVSSYASTESAFGQEILGQDANIQEASFEQ
ncbi:MAG TPA: hypothetical protein VJN94_13785 [Candidatus Binataceae bacterium]|nr:hypothetical protein [Candidatus Binataceae bacterium]